MADATVSRPRARESIPIPDEPQTTATVPKWFGLPIGLGVIWTVIVLGIALFLGFGTVRVGAGNWLGRRLGVGVIWSRFLGYLANQGASPAIIAIVVAAAGLSLLTAAVMLWLALALRDEPAGHRDDSPIARG